MIGLCFGVVNNSLALLSIFVPSTTPYHYIYTIHLTIHLTSDEEGETLLPVDHDSSFGQGALVKKLFR